MSPHSGCVTDLTRLHYLGQSRTLKAPPELILISLPFLMTPTVNGNPSILTSDLVGIGVAARVCVRRQNGRYNEGEAAAGLISAVLTNFHCALGLSTD